jgi:hypothetical protein
MLDRCLVFGGERRTAQVVDASCSHVHAFSVFQFASRDEHIYGKILFMFQLKQRFPNQPQVLLL